MDPRRIKIVNGDVITPWRIIRGGSMLITDGKIEMVSEGAIASDNVLEIDAKGKYIAPGFIDIHVHGGGSHDLIAGTRTAVLKSAPIHARYYTTAMLPST